MNKPPMHEYKLRVYYRDTDAAGIVYHANFLAFGESARMEFLHALGFSQAYLRDNLGIQFVIRHCEVDYQAPARLEDHLIVHTHVENIKNSSLRFIQVVKKEGAVLCQLTITAVCINKQGRPVRIPEELTLALNRFDSALLIDALKKAS